MTNPPNPFATEVPLASLTGEQLRARVARAQLYLVDMAPTAGAEAPPDRLLRDYLAYLYKLEVEGRLYGCGPLDARPGVPPHDLAIIAARSREEAETIAAQDPLQRSGLRRNTVRGHTMNEGVACYVGRALHRRAESLGRDFDPDISGVELSLQALTARPAGVPLHLIWLEPTDKPRPPEDEQTGLDHFVWLRENEMAARLMSCGPVQALQPPLPGAWGGGLAVVATSREEAERIAAAEPSGRAGYRRLRVESWRLDYGLAAPIARALVTLNSLPP